MARELKNSMSSPSNEHGFCILCGRSTNLTFHHLIPRKLHRRNFFRKHFSRDDLNRGIDICRACHNGIHALYSEMELAKKYASLEALREDPALARHVAWVAKQKHAL